MKPDQSSESVEMSKEAASFLSGLEDEYSKYKDIRKRGGFTLAEAESKTGLRRQSLDKKFRNMGLKSEVCYDPNSHQQTRFYFPK